MMTHAQQEIIFAHNLLVNIYLSWFLKNITMYKFICLFNGQFHDLEAHLL